MKKKLLLVLISVCMLFSGSANASTILGFTTAVDDSSGFEIVNSGGTNRNLDFGDLTVTSAINGVDVPELLGADVFIHDVNIDVSTESLLATVGATGFYSYDITDGTITDGFSITLNNTVVLQADLTLTTLFSFGKSANGSPGLEINLTNVDLNLSGLAVGTQDFLSVFASGGDLALSLAANSDIIQTALLSGSPIEGTSGGTATPVPEPFSMLIMGWGALVLYTLKKIGFWIKY